MSATIAHCNSLLALSASKAFPWIGLVWLFGSQPIYRISEFGVWPASPSKRNKVKEDLPKSSLIQTTHAPIHYLGMQTKKGLHTCKSCVHRRRLSSTSLTRTKLYGIFLPSKQSTKSHQATNLDSLHSHYNSGFSWKWLGALWFLGNIILDAVVLSKRWSRIFSRKMEDEFPFTSHLTCPCVKVAGPDGCLTGSKTQRTPSLPVPVRWSVTFHT